MPRIPADVTADLPSETRGEYDRLYGLVSAEMLASQPRWTGSEYRYTVDCAAAHRITRLILRERSR